MPTRPPDNSSPTNPGGPWWREWEPYALVALVVCAYGLRIGDLTVRGEESRWATVAMEMIRTGDWVVPRQQGEPFLSRPPLGSWLIAGATLLRGQCDAVAIRLPTVTAVMLMTLLVHAFSRTLMGRAGAFAAGLAIASMGEVLQMGRVGESDIVFAFLLCAAYIGWLWGEQSHRPEWGTWAVGYGFAALAVLQKGPQGAVCFVAPVAVVLVVRGDWRRLVGLSHLIGLGTFAAIVGTWFVPFAVVAGGAAATRIMVTDSASRFWDLTPAAVVGHLVRYPVEVLGCTAPWSLLLIAYLSRRFRRSLATEAPVVRFLIITSAVGFLPCWLTPTGMTRYVLPVYPGLAVLAGLVVDRIATAVWSPRVAAAASFGRGTLVVVMALSPVALAGMAFLPSSVVRAYAAPASTLAGFAVVAIATAAALAWALRSGRTRLAAAAVALFMAVAYGQIIVDGLIRRSGDTASAVARLKAAMPPGARLVSFEPVHHLFAYHFGDPIELRDGSEAGCDDVTWFCYPSLCDAQNGMGCPVEVVALIPCDRNALLEPREVVIVARKALEAVDGGVPPGRLATTAGTGPAAP